MLERVDENTIMVVPTFGVTYTGAYEPVEAMSKALDQLQADTGLDIDIHVDGASGAFLAPFCAPGRLVRLPPAPGQVDQHLGAQVRAGSAGRRLGHLAGPPGTPRRPGVPRQLPGRRHAGVPDQLLPPGRADHRAVLQLPASRAIEGYRRIHKASYEIGQYLAAEIVKLGPFELLCDSNPDTGIPTVTWRIREGADPGYTLFDLADRLRDRGWQVPAYTLTGTASDIPVQRILVRLG